MPFAKIPSYIPISTILFGTVCVDDVAVPTAATAPFGFANEPAFINDSAMEVPLKSPVAHVINVAKGVI